jgi:polysaccharide export outer membrane protein
LKPLLLLLPFLLLTAGCVRHKELVNFNLTQLEAMQQIANQQELRIQPEDLLRITVHSFDLDAAQPFNLENLQQQQNMMMMQQMGIGAANPMEYFQGYFVDLDGKIDFPVLGPIQAGGLTLDELKANLYTAIQPYLKDATINIRYLNFKVTILGEVMVPGTKRLSNKRVTLLEALGMAGDLTPYANRERILVMREAGDQREFAYLNLRTDEVFVSPFFYLQQNDVIYIEPTKAKIAVVQDPLVRWLGFGSATLSLAALIVTLVR